LEPITHFLTGACLGRAGFNRRTSLATATMTLAAEAPDLDILTRFKSAVYGFAHHRGFTHSFLGLLLVSAFVVGFMYLVWRVRGRKTKDPNLPPRWGLLFALAYLAGLSHILLDFTNNYGVRPLWPFSERWYSWDIVFIVEPVLYVLLLGAFILPALFSLINDEIGARTPGPKGRTAATVALMGTVLLWGIRDYEHRRAVVALESQTYQEAPPLRVSAYPYWWNVFRWSGVVETSNFFAVAPVDSASPAIDPENHMQVRYKPEETPATLAAKRSYLGRVFLDWAKYPVTETERVTSGPPGYIVRFRDLRFQYPEMSGRNPLGASVRLDDNLHVIGYSMGTAEKFEPATE
jgi:inner membrane protein